MRQVKVSLSEAQVERVQGVAVERFEGSVSRAVRWLVEQGLGSPQVTVTYDGSAAAVLPDSASVAAADLPPAAPAKAAKRASGDAPDPSRPHRVERAERTPVSAELFAGLPSRSEALAGKREPAAETVAAAVRRTAGMSKTDALREMREANYEGKK